MEKNNHVMVADQFSILTSNIENINFHELISEILNYIFFPYSQVSQLVNCIIYIIAAFVAAWIALQFAVVVFLYVRVKLFKRTIRKAKTDGVIKPDQIEGLAKKHKIRLILKKINVISRLREDQNGILDTIDHIDDEIKWRTYGLLKYPISSLVIFGLLGTVWGLQKSIYSLLPTMQSQLDLAKLQQVMEGTLIGMQTAFSTTLAGLVFSVILGFLATLGLRNLVNNYLLMVKTFLIQDIMPVYTLLGSEHMNSLTERTKELKETITDVVKQSDILFQPIINSANTFKSGMDQIFSAAHTFVDASENVDKMSSTLNGTLIQLSGSLGAVKNAIDESKSIQEDIEKTISHISKLPDFFEKLMIHLADEFKEHQNKTEEKHSNKVSEQMENLTTAIQTLLENTKAWQEETSKSGDFLRTAAKESTGELYKGTQDMLEQVTQTTKNMETINDTINESLQAMDARQKALSSQFVSEHKFQTESITKALNDFINRTQGNQDHNNKQIVDAISKWAGFNQNLIRAMEKIQ